MNSKEFKHLLKSPSFHPQSPYLRSIAKQSFDIHLSGQSDALSCSRFGGIPYVAKGFQWPKHDSGEYRFLGQINFREIETHQSPLPQSGLLSIFYAYDEDGEIFWGDDQYVLAYYWDEGTEFTCITPPDEQSLPKAIALNITESIHLPTDTVLRDDWVLNDDVTEALYERLDALQAQDYLLGYPSFFTLGYDPTPKGNWISLLTITSHDAFEWCWHDGDKLMIFIVNFG